jgi:glucokinase
MRLDHPALLLGDIGGTTVRFAWLTQSGVGPVEHLTAHSYTTFADALLQFLRRHGAGVHPAAAAFAVAGVVTGQRCVLTNSSWIIDSAELTAKLGLARVHLVNDFEAIAWSLPHLGRADLHALGGSRPGLVDAPVAVLGPGTGLGVAALVPSGERAIVVTSEGGHGTLPSTSFREDRVIEHLRAQFGHVSSERVLSGPGLENLYRAIASVEGLSVPERSAADITQAAISGACPVSMAALDMFCATLGSVAGNIALTFGARGGFFIAGGIVPRIADYVASSQFRAHFEAKGRFRAYLEAIPVDVVLNTDAAFIGLRSLAAQLELAGASAPRAIASSTSMATSSVATRCEEIGCSTE